MIYQNPGVAEVAVFGVHHWIEAVAAAVVAREGHTVDPEEPQRFCRASLAGYKVPKYVRVVDALPKRERETAAPADIVVDVEPDDSESESGAEDLTAIAEASSVTPAAERLSPASDPL